MNLTNACTQNVHKQVKVIYGVKSQDHGGGRGDRDWKGEQGGSCCFLVWGPNYMCVFQLSNPPTNRTLMSCTLLESPLYFSKSLRKGKRKQKVTCPKSHGGSCWQNRVLGPRSRSPTELPREPPPGYPGQDSVPKSSGSSQLEFCVPGAPGNPALGYASSHHFHGD